MKNIKQTIIFLSILFCSLSQVNAQLTGYGSGSFSPSNYIHNTGTLYTDNIRAKGTNYTLISGTTADVDLNNFHGTINNGDKLLIIQMKGSSIGTHQAVTVTGIAGNTYSIQTVSSEPMLNYSASGSNRFQVIKINEYYDFTLNGGLVTCNNWDDADGSGGVLALMVSHTLTVNFGLFSVGGKGFTPE